SAAKEAAGMGGGRKKPPPCLAPSAAGRLRPRDAASDRSPGDRARGADDAITVIPGWCASTRPGISRFSGAQLRTIVRCFASPRNDSLYFQDTTQRSRGAISPESCTKLPPRKSRGRRESRVLSGTRSLACNKQKAHERSHHRFAETPAFPAQWF